MRRTERFKEFLEEVEKRDEGEYPTPLDVPPDIFQDPGWLTVDRDEYFDRFSHYVEFQVQRAASETDMYPRDIQEELKDYRIEETDDFYRVPGIPKDATTGELTGLRDKISRDPGSNRPDDVPYETASSPWESGGTKGDAVPTWITPWDREVESAAFALLFEQTGVERGAFVFDCYNAQGHKGGFEVIEALDRLGCDQFPAKIELGAPEIMDRIERYPADDQQVVLDTVPVPRGEDWEQSDEKGAGRTLGDFIHHDTQGLREHVDLVALGGDRMTPKTLEWLESPFGVDASAIYGATEVLPLFYSHEYPKHDDWECTRNNMHVHYGPHFAEVVKHEDGELVPADEEERGLLAVTNVFRQGTPYTRYLIGDGAERVERCDEHATEIFREITREAVPEDMETACAGI